MRIAPEAGGDHISRVEERYTSDVSRRIFNLYVFPVLSDHDRDFGFIIEACSAIRICDIATSGQQTAWHNARLAHDLSG